ncbi:MAG TPA: hypothetical protein VN193_01095 [Candidatus Angelobacter sp.]|nr:hypothetical protein [Candidatus Angelobacter sp.]
MFSPSDSTGTKELAAAMRHLARLASAGLAAGLAVTACGGATSPLQGKTPKQIITLASTSITSTSYHLTMHGGVSYDASGIQGLPAGTLSQITGSMQNMTIDGSGDVQDSTHARMAMTMKPLVDKSLQMVIDGDHVYMSEDSGATWADLGSFNFNGLPVSPSDAASVLRDLSNVQDMGATARNGSAVEHMHATVPPDYLSKQLSKIGGTGQLGQMMQQLSTLITQAMTLKDGSVDAYVRSADGRMDSMDTHVVIAIDMGKFMAALMQAFSSQAPSAMGTLPNVSGSLTIAETVTEQFSNYGAKVTITKPNVDPNAPTLPGGGLFGA